MKVINYHVIGKKKAYELAKEWIKKHGGGDKWIIIEM